MIRLGAHIFLACGFVLYLAIAIEEPVGVGKMVYCLVAGLMLAFLFFRTGGHDDEQS